MPLYDLLRKYYVYIIIPNASGAAATDRIRSSSSDGPDSPSAPGADLHLAAPQAPTPSRRRPWAAIPEGRGGEGEAGLPQ